MNSVNTLKIPVQITNLQRQLGGQTILQDITTQVRPGDVVGLLGKNGSGKTTLLETLLGFGAPAFGQCQLWGEKSTELAPATKQRIGYVPQRDELPGEMTPKQLFDLYRQLRPEWNDDLLKQLMPEWELSEGKRIRRMSEGQKQKLAIVLAVAHNPDLLVLDEPVASLDPIARRQFFQQLMDYACREHTAIIFSSHIVSDMERIVSRVWCLQNGTLTCDQPLDTLYETVVRVDYSGALTDKAVIGIDQILFSQNSPHGGQLVIKDWNDAKREQLLSLGASQVKASGLSLEDIFLYWHGGTYAN
ncbi:ABC transporter ATP-binding protein [Gilvimarinus xylanilyticus]|uniref:ABC transporter ATP-binding protein n=1 Tax=Gilvimarinus xylanilyticus TaxID=2944139 RepID=A0A9X2HVL1_9GAMM|nr:ABC transporter ATP-binding protein [Gilvimarinus xylanilyticus]MCP8899223.1 ABC transporter ATP-binding protein [Gilvimarinus xylanilyticus]